METNKQQLFKQLSQSFPQLTGNDAVPLNIKMGRNVVFKGTLDAPVVDKLTDSQLAILESALNAPTNDGSSLEAGSPKGTINIEVGDQKVFRYANGQVEINAIQPPQVQQAEPENYLVAAAGQYLGPFDDRDEAEDFAFSCEQSLGMMEIIKGLPEGATATPVKDWVFEQQFGNEQVKSLLKTLEIDNIQNLPAWTAAIPTANSQSLQMSLIGDTLKLHQVIENTPNGKAIDLSFDVLEDGNFALKQTLIKGNVGFYPDIANHYLQQWEQGIQFEQQQSLELKTYEEVELIDELLGLTNANTLNQATEDVTIAPPLDSPQAESTLLPLEGIEELIPQGIEGRGEEKGEGEKEALVSADTIAVMELHDHLPTAARQWLLDKFQEVAQSGIGEDLKAKGATVARAALEGLRAAPAVARDRAICDSALSLVKSYGTLDMTQETPQMVYQAEGYTVRLQSSKAGALSLNDIKGMNHCTVEDASGNAILTFKHEGIKGIEVLSNNCSLDQQYDLARAGAYLAGAKTHQAVQTASTQLKAIGEQLGAISQGLANLAVTKLLNIAGQYRT